MDRDLLLHSAWLKWGRAVHHARILQTEIDAGPTITGQDDPLVSVRTEYHPRRQGFGVYASEVLGIPADWGLLLGDIANNYRCALDHLAWALVSRGKTPPEVLSGQQRRVYFPVAQNRQLFNRSLAKRLPGVRRSDVATVRASQPYHYGKKRRVQHSFVILADLNNRDKHRSIEPVWAHTTKLEITITGRHDCINPRSRRLISGPRPLKVGAELAVIHVRKTGPEPRLEVETRWTGVPSIEPGVGLIDWVTQTGLQIGILLGEFSEPPEEVAQAAAWLTT